MKILLISLRSLLLICLTASCIGEQSKIIVSLPSKNARVSTLKVTNLSVINSHFTLNGENLNNVSSIKINDAGSIHNLKIVSQNSGRIIAEATANLILPAQKILAFILSDAVATTTFSVSFSLCDSTLGGKQINCSLPPNDKEVLAYDAVSGKWKPSPLNGLSYVGTWDATTPPPSANSAGEYFIVSVANPPFNVGDWIVYNGTTFDQISNASGVTTVFGRAGIVDALEGDYDLDKLLDVDLSTPPINGKVLKYDGSKWIAADDLGGGTSTIITSAISNGAVTDSKIDTISASKITGTITSSQILDGTIANADISATAGITYSKLNIGAGDIPADRISGLPTGTSVLTTSITDGDTTHAPDGNTVFDALALKLGLAGGTLNPGATITGLPSLPLSGSEAASKNYVDSKSNPWSKNVDTLYYNVANAKVGIKTSSPTGEFSVNGRVDLGAGVAISAHEGAPNAVNIWSPTEVTTSVYTPETALRIVRASDHSSRFSSMFDIAIGSYGGHYGGSTQVDFILSNGASYTPDMKLMSLLASGRVGIRNANPMYSLDVVGDINASATVKAAGITLTSDKRWKRNIKPLENVIEKLMKIKGVSYLWARKDYPEKDFSPNKQIGIIAQDVMNVFPELVYKDAQGYLSVNYPALIAPLIEAFKSQQSEIEMLKKQKNSIALYLCEKDPDAPFCSKE